MLIVFVIYILLFFVSILIYQIDIWSLYIILIYYDSFALSWYFYFVRCLIIKIISIICIYSFIFLNFLLLIIIIWIIVGYFFDIGFISALITYNWSYICRNKHFNCSYWNTLFAFKFFSSETIWHFYKKYIKNIVFIKIKYNNNNNN